MTDAQAVRAHPVAAPAPRGLCTDCDGPRPDLLRAGPGTPTAGFGFVLPAALLDGTPRMLTVRYSDGACLPMQSPSTSDSFAFRLGEATA